MNLKSLNNGKFVDAGYTGSCHADNPLRSQWKKAAIITL